MRLCAERWMSASVCPNSIVLYSGPLKAPIYSSVSFHQAQWSLDNDGVEYC